MLRSQDERSDLQQISQLIRDILYTLQVRGRDHFTVFPNSNCSCPTQRLRRLQSQGTRKSLFSVARIIFSATMLKSSKRFAFYASGQDHHTKSLQTFARRFQDFLSFAACGSDILHFLHCVPFPLSKFHYLCKIIELTFSKDLFRRFSGWSTGSSQHECHIWCSFPTILYLLHFFGPVITLSFTRH